MAAEPAIDNGEPNRKGASNSPAMAVLSSYLGVSFAVFLAFLPKNAVPYVSSLQARNRLLAVRLLEAEEQLRQLRQRRREDARANARAAEIFAGHRHAWLEAERRLLSRLSEAHSSEARLRASVERLERELAERDTLLNNKHMGEHHIDRYRESSGNGYKDTALELAFRVATGGEGEEVEEEEAESELVPDSSSSSSFFESLVENSAGGGGGGGGGGGEFDDMAAATAAAMVYAAQDSNYFGDDVFPVPPACTTGNTCSSAPNAWQDMKFDSLESTYSVKHTIPRRESPWKVDVESSGVPAKLKLLEEELTNLEKVGKGDLSKIPSLMRKQAKRYQSLTGKIDDLCKRMQVSDPTDPSVGPEFRTQRQTEYLLEAFRLQQRATETRHKLGAIQSETVKSSFGDNLTAQTKLNTRRSLDSIQNNFKEIQRNLEVWLARILGDLEGMLARDGASRMRDYYFSSHSFAP